VFTFRAIQYPASIPISLASLNLIQQTTTSFSNTIFNLVHDTASVAEVLDNVRKLYEIATIPNKVVDGRDSLAQDEWSQSHGVSVEFRKVSFSD
jgi:hypothetical protein